MVRKFRNQPRAGFDSGKEHRVYADLVMQRCAKVARDRVVKIERQVTYELLPRQIDRETGRVIERAVTYRADFVVDYADDRREVIDAKSPPTRKLPAYVLKRKLMLFRYGIRIREV